MQFPKEISAAAIEGEVDIIDEYLNQGNDINFKDDKGNTLLLLSMSEDWFNDELPLYLLEKNIKVDGKIECDKMLNASALHLAYRHGESNSAVFFELLKHPDIDINAVADDNIMSWEGWLQETINPEVGNSPPRFRTTAYFLENATVLHYAAIIGDVQTVTKLCQHEKLAINAPARIVLDKNLISTMVVIEEDDNFTDNEQLLAEKIGKLGLGWTCRQGVPVHRTAEVTALHLASLADNIDVVHKLLEYGANPNPIDSDTVSPFDYAVTSNNNNLAKFYQTLADHTENFTNGGYYLNPHKVQVFYDIEGARKREYKRMLDCEQRFFSIKRMKKESTHFLAEGFYKNRKGKSQSKLNISKIPARRLITADAASIQKSLTNIGPNQLNNREAIAKNIGWPNQWNKKYNKYDYSWQNVQLDTVNISYIHTPSPGQLGGYFMKDIGKYEDIIKNINAITHGKKENGQLLARAMQNYAQTGEIPIKIRQKLNITDEQYQMLMKICFHTSVKEITRRMFPGKADNNGEMLAVEFPFATCHAQCLELIINGHLEIEKVFSQDAEYGLFTGSNITSLTEGRNKLMVKIKKINQLYNDKILIAQSLPAKRIAALGNTTISASPEHFHQVNIATYGGASDSEGEEYFSENENCISVKK